MNNEPIYTWDQENGIATCTIVSDFGKFITSSHCHPDDMDMCSEKTGCQIALYKMSIKVNKYYRDVLKHQIAALEHLYNSMRHSKKFNENSYENKMLQNQLRLLKLDLATAKEMIASEEQELREYIDEKEKFYTKIRRNRQRSKEYNN